MPFLRTTVHTSKLVQMLQPEISQPRVLIAFAKQSPIPWTLATGLVAATVPSAWVPQSLPTRQAIVITNIPIIAYPSWIAEDAGYIINRRCFHLPCLLSSHSMINLLPAHCPSLLCVCVFLCSAPPPDSVELLTRTGQDNRSSMSLPGAVLFLT